MMRRERQILQAAEDLFYEKGFDATGVDAIAERVGITGGGIYRYFASKDEILGVLFDELIDTALEQLPSLTDDPGHDLRALIEAHVSLAMEYPKLAGIWTREQRSLTDPYRRNYLRRERRYSARWRTSLERCYPGRSREELSAAMRAVHALTLSDSARPASDRQADDIKELLVQMTIRSLTALERQSIEALT
jgi:AcrR family transcriptional regulator